MDVASFGQFAILFALYTIVSGLVRAYSSELLVYKYSAILKAELQGAVHASTSAVILMGFCLAVICAGPMIFQMPGWESYMILASAIVPLLVREHVRVVLTIERRGGMAFFLELLFVFLMIPTLHPALSSSLPMIMTVWSVGSWITALLAFVRAKIRFTLAGGRFWIRTERRDGRFYAGDFLVTNGMNQGTVFAVAALGTIAASAAIRSVQVLLTPILLVTRGLLVAVGPEARRAAAAGNTSLLAKLSVGYAASVAIMCALAVFLVNTVPESWVRIILGDSTPLALDLFLPAALAVTSLGVASGAALGLRALGEIRLTFLWKIISAPASLLAVIAGTYFAGASGSQLGLMAGEVIRGSANWFLLRRTLKSPGGFR